MSTSLISFPRTLKPTKISLTTVDIDLYLNVTFCEIFLQVKIWSLKYYCSEHFDFHNFVTHGNETTRAEMNFKSWSQLNVVRDFCS